MPTTQTVSSSMTPRKNCPHCFLCLQKCICSTIQILSSEYQVIILQHLRERHKAIGTEKIVRLSLPNTVTIRAYQFQNHEDLNSLLNDPKKQGFLLYPSASALQPEQVQSEPYREKFLVVLDGTWSHAQSIYQSCPQLQTLQHVTLPAVYRSNYRIRTQPNSLCLSTVEAVAYCLEALEKAPQKYHSMLHTFDRMIDQQCHEIPTEILEHRPKYKKEIL